MYLKLFLISEKENMINLVVFNSKYIVIIGRYYYVMLNVIKWYKRFESDYLLLKFYVDVVEID